MIMHMEFRVVIGVLIGICTAWALSDALLVGLETQHIVYSIVTLGVTVMLWRVMTSCLLARRSFFETATTTTTLRSDDDEPPTTRHEIVNIF